jgi:hypothetical protein
MDSSHSKELPIKSKYKFPITLRWPTFHIRGSYINRYQLLILTFCHKISYLCTLTYFVFEFIEFGTVYAFSKS